MANGTDTTTMRHVEVLREMRDTDYLPHDEHGGYGVERAALDAAIAALAGQADAVPVAWHTEDQLTDKSATTYDKAVADRWIAKGWPVTPMYYTTPPAAIPVDALRATVCGFTPGMGRVELQLPGNVPDWLDLGAIVLIAGATP